MKHTLCLALIVVLAFTVVARSASAPTTHPVDVKWDEWKDAARERVIPVKLYLPRLPADAKPAPVILLSHGLGGTREAIGYAAQAWAEHGYVCVALQHPGSDAGVWQNANGDRRTALTAAANAQQLIARVKDVKFALDKLAELNKSDATLKGRLDLDHVGIAGHSFGAHTVMAVAGQQFLRANGQTASARDPRIKAAIALSPAPPSNKQTDLDAAYAEVKIPVLHITGTRDVSPIGDAKPADRRVPFDHSKSADAYLAVFDGADHMAFGGSRVRGLEGTGDVDRVHQDVGEVGNEFWDAYLKGDTTAKAWLTDGPAKTLLEGSATWETRHP